MKKIAILVTAVVLSLSAESKIQSINVGANSATINSETGSGFTIGYGGEKHYDNGILFGVDMNYDSSNIKDETFDSFGSDVKIGYIYKKVGAYAIGSAIYQNFHNTEAVGLGYGVGLEYLVYEHIGVAVDYKTYKMSAAAMDYDFDTLKAYLKIMF